MGGYGHGVISLSCTTRSDANPCGTKLWKFQVLYIDRAISRKTNVCSLEQILYTSVHIRCVLHVLYMYTYQDHEELAYVV